MYGKLVELATSKRRQSNEKRLTNEVSKKEYDRNLMAISWYQSSGVCRGVQNDWLGGFGEMLGRKALAGGYRRWPSM